jgi:glycosyltransferase involved in cell wall biosynthesis
MWVFNDAQFLTQSIDSILKQKTNFRFEIVIHDDASKDESQKILKEYQIRFPKIIKLILQSENQYSKGYDLLQPVWQNCKYKYLALTHGDDYWTDPYKIQKQYDVLESNSGAVGVFHDVDFVDSDGVKVGAQCGSKPVIGISDLLESNRFVTSSVVFRRNAFVSQDPVYSDLKIGDWPLWLQIATKGCFINIPHRMSAYRVHSGGLWSGATSIVRSKTEIHMRICAASSVPLAHRNFALTQLAIALAKYADSLFEVASLSIEPTISSSSRRLTHLLTSSEIVRFELDWVNYLILEGQNFLTKKQILSWCANYLVAMGEFETLFGLSSKSRLQKLTIIHKCLWGCLWRKLLEFRIKGVFRLTVQIIHFQFLKWR